MLWSRNCLKWGFMLNLLDGDKQGNNLSYPQESNTAAVVELNNETWARRVSGVFGNFLANETPSRAHAVIRKKDSGTYVVSVRAPLENKTGADEIVSQFPSGGGRKAAAGINDLPPELLEAFIDSLGHYYS
jgi:hypothetical protein